jgi:hypothetical protein
MVSSVASLLLQVMVIILQDLQGMGVYKKK